MSSSPGASSNSTILQRMKAEGPTLDPISTPGNKPIKRSSGEQVDTTVTKKPRIAKTLYDEIVKIDVGTAKTEFEIYRGKLCSVSPFFTAIYESKATPNAKAACRVTATKTSLQVHLHVEDPNLFERFISWIYDKTIFIEHDESEKTVLWSVLTDVFLFAVRWDIPLLQTSMIDLAVQKYSACSPLPQPTDINKVYKDNLKAPLVHPFRKLLVDIFAMCGDDFITSSNFHQYSSYFLAALVRRLKLLKLAAEFKLEMVEKKSKKSDQLERYNTSLLIASDYYYRRDRYPIVLDA